ncbi:MAG: cytochrome c maturation protein CcmE [Mesorhizobium sp.]
MIARSRRKSRRLLVLGGAGLVLGLAAALLLTALRDDIVFFRSPTDILQEATNEKTRLRLGGMVEDGSLARSADGLTATFLVTDGTSSVPVSYHGILPDLFREGQGVIAEGSMQAGTFQAVTVLAKHDENYMPREVKDALDRGGYERRGDAAIVQETSALPQ